ncbi:MAG: hypothetical protein L0216_19755 [Planctomycetales bacterium]|nr:hypothetical protein [Planctomycetales bacterium]
MGYASSLAGFLVAAAAGIARGQDPAEDAAGLLASGRPAEAAAAAERALATSPGDPALLSLLGRARLRLAGPTEDRAGAAAAEDALARAVDRGAADPATFVALAQVRRLLAGGAPDEATARVYKAGAAEAGARALAAARQDVERAPGDLLARKRLADTTLLLEDPAGAAPLYAALLADLPADAPSDLVRDVRLAWRSCYEVRLAPGAPPEGIASLAGEFARSALALLARRQEHGEIRGDAAAILRRAAQLLADRGRHGDAARVHVEAIRVSGGATEEDFSYRVAWLTALELVKRSARDEGRAILAALRDSLGPGRARARVLGSLAVEAWNDGRIPDALETCRRAVEDAGSEAPPVPDPTDLRSELWNNLGLIQFGEGDLAGARASFERSLAESRGSIFARENLARLAEREGRRDDARRLLLEALDAAAALPEESARLQHSWRLRTFLRWLDAAPPTGR